MQGQVLLGLGNALAMQGQSEEAAGILNQSVDLFNSVRATSHLAQAQAALEALAE
jgi:hypothetical protein